VLIIRRSKLYYTASGIITPVGGRPVHRLRQDSLSWLITKIILRCMVSKTLKKMQNAYYGNFQGHGVGKDKVHSMKFHHKDRAFLIPQK